MNTRTVKAVGIALTLGVTSSVLPRLATAEHEEQPTAVVQAKRSGRIKAFMRKKLVAADQILEGITTPDYGMIQKGAGAMIQMTKEATWETRADPVYAQDSVDFVRSAERLVKLANQKDLEGATQTYAKLVVQCVDCHKHVRGSLPGKSGTAVRTQAWNEVALSLSAKGSSTRLPKELKGAGRGGLVDETLQQQGAVAAMAFGTSWPRNRVTPASKYGQSGQQEPLAEASPETR